MRELNAFRKYTDSETFSKIVNYDSVTDMWENSVKNYGNLNALTTNVDSVSYLELENLVAEFRAVLIKNGVTQGDMVGIYIKNSIDFVKAFLAVTTIGAVAVLLPPHLDSLSLFGCSLKFNLKALVYLDSLKENLTVIQEKNKGVILLSSGERSLEKINAVKVDKNSVCCIVFTGGTTGKSKGSVLSHQAVMRGTTFGAYGYKEVFTQRYLLVLPLTHVFGLIRNLLTSLYTGSSLFICENNKDMFRDIATFKPTILVLVPALAEMSLKLSKTFNKNMLGESLQTIICGAAFVPPYLITEFAKMGIRLLAGYGLTESANLVSGNPEPENKPNSVGLIYPDVQYKVVEQELWLKGVSMQNNYYGEAEENEIAYSEDGYFKTGDLVRFDQDGFLYITGRKKEIIVLPSGENVSPAELEAKFAQIDLIQDCLVYENDLGGLDLEVLLRDTVIALNKVKDPKRVVEEKVFDINKTLAPFERITNIKFRETDFIRSPAMKIVRNKNGNVKN